MRCSLREVLANGHGDTYYQYRTGQAFRLGDLEDGTYFVAVEANPDDEDGRNLQELDVTNNESYRKVELFTNAKGAGRCGWPRSGSSTSSTGSSSSGCAEPPPRPRRNEGPATGRWRGPRRTSAGRTCVVSPCAR